MGPYRCAFLSYLLTAGFLLAEVPTTQREKYYDGKLNEVTDAIAHDPALAQYFSGDVHVSKMFWHAGNGRLGWISERMFSKDARQVPSINTQAAFRTEIDSPQGVYLDIIIWKDDFPGKKPSCQKAFPIDGALAVRIGYSLYVLGNDQAVRGRIDSAIQSKFKMADLAAPVRSVRLTMLKRQNGACLSEGVGWLDISL